jgi:hypothetical protein
MSPAAQSDDVPESAGDVGFAIPVTAVAAATVVTVVVTGMA